MCQITTWKQPTPHLGAPYSLAWSWKQTPKWKQMLKRASSSTLLYNPCFHPFSLSPPLCPLLWPNITSGGVRGVEKIRVKQWWSKWRTVMWKSLISSSPSESNYRRHVARRLSQGQKTWQEYGTRALCLAGQLAAEDHGNWFLVRLKWWKTDQKLLIMLIFWYHEVCYAWN